MDTRLSEKQARIRILMVAIFYLISGFWEYLVGLAQEESISTGIYFLLDTYRSYAVNLGLITMWVGILIIIGMLFKIKIIRALALILAWWNLFTAPIIAIWWNIYAVLVKRFETTDSWLGLWVYTILLLSIITAIRLYIISMLRVSKAGYVFSKKEEKCKD